MRNELNKKIDDLLRLIDKDDRMIALSKEKEILLNNNELINRINRLKELDIYSSEYQELKKELFENKEFVSFKEKENEINFLILEINNRLRTLTNERRCNHESN